MLIQVNIITFLNTVSNKEGVYSKPVIRNASHVGGNDKVLYYKQMWSASAGNIIMGNVQCVVSSHEGDCQCIMSTCGQL